MSGNHTISAQIGFSLYEKFRGICHVLMIPQAEGVRQALWSWIQAKEQQVKICKEELKNE